MELSPRSVAGSTMLSPSAGRSVSTPSPSVVSAMLAAPPLTLHAPPTSAVPQPAVVVRSKVSDAACTSSVTTTVEVAVWDSPSSSVTVRVTVYEPAAAYSWFAVTPEAVSPSPNVHA